MCARSRDPMTVRRRLRRAAAAHTLRVPRDVIKRQDLEPSQQ